MKRLKKIKDEKSAGRVTPTNRKCPFCGAINRPFKPKCRKCMLPLPQYPDLKGKGEGKIFQITLKDTRTWFMHLADYIETIPAVILGVAGLIRLLNLKAKYPEGYEHYIAGVVPLVAAGLYFFSGGTSATEQCRNCGKTMVIRVPLRQNAFPGAVQCWACGAIHTIEWKGLWSKIQLRRDKKPQIGRKPFGN